MYQSPTLLQNTNQTPYCTFSYRRTELTISVARSNINDTMKEFHCSYCKGQGHFASHCLKRITKSCTDSICRDYNRFEHSNCKFGDSCVYNRRCVCLLCTDANCKAYFHVHSASQSKGWSTLPKKNENLINALVKVIEKISEVLSVTKLFSHKFQRPKIRIRPTRHRSHHYRQTMQIRQQRK